VTSYTLVPVAQSYGNPMTLSNEDTWESPTVQGSLSDGDDGTYTSLAAGLTADTVRHVDTVSCDFQFDGSLGTPTAAFLQIRARNNADVLADPPINNRQVWIEARSVADGTVYSDNPSPTPVVQPLLDVTVVDLAEFDFWWGDPPNPDDPTDGNWLDFDIGVLNPGAGTALTGAGLRVTLAFFWVGDSTTSLIRTWMDVSEMRLIVAAGAPAATPQPYRARQRLYPIAPARRWPREAWTGSSSRRVGGYR
jgi:hypothetical protein